MIHESKGQVFEEFENFVTYKYLPLWSPCGNFFITRWNKKVQIHKLEDSKVEELPYLKNKDKVTDM